MHRELRKTQSVRASCVPPTKNGCLPTRCKLPAHLEIDLLSVAEDLNRLRLDWRDAERFFIGREELVNRLHALALSLEARR